MIRNRWRLSRLTTSTTAPVGKTETLMDPMAQTLAQTCLHQNGGGKTLEAGKHAFLAVNCVLPCCSLVDLPRRIHARKLHSHCIRLMSTMVVLEIPGSSVASERYGFNLLVSTQAFISRTISSEVRVFNIQLHKCREEAYA